MENLEYQLEHLAITVTNLEKSVDWYKTNFGFQEIKRFNKPELELKGATLKLENFTLEIIQPYSLEPLRERNESLNDLLKKPRINHFALTTENLVHSYNELKNRGVELVTELTERYFFCRDFDGTLIEVRQKLT